MSAALLFLSRHFVPLAFLVLAAVVAERIGSFVVEPARLDTGRDLVEYNVSYFEYGVIKRGLAGTLGYPVRLFSAMPKLWYLGFVMIVAIGLAGIAIVLVARLFPHPVPERLDLAVLLRCAVAVGPLGVVQVWFEHGRLDQLNLLILAAALAACLSGRPGWCALLATLGVLVHEAFAVYGVPLLLAAVWTVSRRPGRDVAVLALGAGVAALAVLLWGSSGAVTEIGPEEGYRFWQRGLFEPVAPAPLDVLVLLWGWGALGAILWWFYRHNRLRPDPVLAACACPPVLNLLGIDGARWLAVGFAVTLAALAFHRVRGCSLPEIGRGRTLAVAILFLPLGPIGVVRPFPWLP